MEKDVIKILIEPYVSREHSLIPYVGQNVEKELRYSDYIYYDNWNEFPYDIDLTRCGSFLLGDMTNIIPSEFSIYFNDLTRIPFKMLVDKMFIFNDILRNATYYKVITKNGEKKLIEKKPSLADKLYYIVYDNEDDIINNFDDFDNGVFVGVYGNNSFLGNGGKKMLHFLLRAMGQFAVPSIYIKKDNGVPEIMTYSQVTRYLDEMRKNRNNPDCCNLTKYEYMGGNSFDAFLCAKKNEISDEIVYWQKALYKEGKKIPSPFITVNVLLTADNYITGESLPIETIDIPTGITTQSQEGIGEILTNSELIKLKRNTLTSEYYKAEIKEYEEKDFPMVLKEILDEDDIVMYYELENIYEENRPCNIIKSNKFNDVIYGDIIYKVVFHENKTVDIYYAIGARLIKTETGYKHYDTYQKTLDIITFNEFINDFGKHKITIEDYLYLTEEFKNTGNFNDKIIIKNMFENDISFPTNTDEVWVYFIGGNDVYCLTRNTELNGEEILYFNTDLIEIEAFTGLRFLERKTWEEINFTDIVNCKYRILQLKDESNNYANILTTKDKNKNYIVHGATNAKVIDTTINTDIVKGIFFRQNPECETIHPSLGMDYNFGHVETNLQNLDDIALDRGYVSAMEILYKMGEVNSLEDMENYQNNIFGI